MLWSALRMNLKIKFDIYNSVDMRRLFSFVHIFSTLLFMVSACTVSESGSDRSVMMLRLRPTNTDTDKDWEDTYKIICENPGCCDEVWFSTGMGYLSQDWHKDKVGRIGKAMSQLEKVGVVSSLQFQMTIGHGDKFGYTNEHLFSEMNWDGWVGSTGEEAKFCSCPRDPRFLEHIRMVAGIYASLKPSYIWVDDDLRYDNHKPATLDSHIGCWCDRCIADFNGRVRGNWTRTTLASALSEDSALSDEWHSFCIETLCDIAACISQEVHAVSPHTKMAFQAKKEDFVVPHVSAILAVMHEKTGLPVGYRPGTGPRFDMDGASAQIVKSMQSARFVKLLGNPAYVDVWCPEIETYPRVYGSRTGQGVLIEGFTALAYGLNSISMFIMAADKEAPELYSRSLLRPIADGADVLREYARQNEGTSVAGFQTDTSCDVLYAFARTGVPVLPGMGVSLGDLSADYMSVVDIPKMLSSDIQKLRNNLDSLSTIPALCESPFVGLVIPRVRENGDLKTVALVNTRIDAQEDIRIRLSGLPGNTPKYAIWREMKKKPVKLRLEHSSSGETFAVIPEISAWNAGFIAFE